jgi:hypothetical protein
MKIGLFGDSYIDVIWHRHPEYQVPQEKKVWSGLLLEDLGSDVITSGLGGSNQYYAINEWKKAQEQGIVFDYAFFTFTWDNRLYMEDAKWQKMLSAHAERRELYEQDKPLFTDDEVANGVQALDLYYRYLHNNKQAAFNFELMVKWCLDLPAQFPDTKFIFLPNTELSRGIALQYFTQGVLVDFAFETLSNREPGSPGPMPINCGRYGHLKPWTHDLFKEFAKDIVVNYNNYKNKILPFDYSKFTG